MTPEIALTDPDLLTNPFTGYARAREQAPMARLVAPGMPPMWALTRHAEARAMLTDPRFALNPASFQRPDVPAHCLPYLRTMQEMEGAEHARLRRLVTPAFSARRAADFRPRITPLVDALLDTLEEGKETDLLRDFATPLPIDVICELVGVPAEDRPQWRRHGTAVAAGHGKAFAEAIPTILDGAKKAVADHQEGSLIAMLRQAGGDLTDTELVTLVWHLVLAGQTPGNLIANAVETLVEHPDQLAALRADESLMPGAVDELIRWCGPQLLTIPRFATEDVKLAGALVREGEAVTVAIAAVNRDPRAFADPDRFDIRRPPAAAGHLGFAHGPHFCLGAPLARVETEEALTGLLRRFPRLAIAPGGTGRIPDPGTWRLTALQVTVG